MKVFAATAALVALVPAIAALTINTPVNVVQCQPLLVTWADGTPPYFVSVIPGGQPTAPALKTFPTQTGNTFTWIVDIARGTPLTLSLKDNTGAQAFSDIFTVLDSSDSKCVNSTVQVDGTGGTQAPGTTNAAPSATGTTTRPAASGTTTTTGTSKPAGTSTGSSASNTNAASASFDGAFGLAGVMGLVGAVVALF